MIVIVFGELFVVIVKRFLGFYWGTNQLFLWGEFLVEVSPWLVILMSDRLHFPVIKCLIIIILFVIPQSYIELISFLFILTMPLFIAIHFVKLVLNFLHKQFSFLVNLELLQWGELFSFGRFLLERDGLMKLPLFGFGWRLLI